MITHCLSYYCVLCIFAYLYARPFIRVGLGSAQRTYHSFCGNGTLRVDRGTPPFKAAVCAKWLHPILTQDYPRFASWMLYGEGSAHNASAAGDGADGRGGIDGGSPLLSAQRPNVTLAAPPGGRGGGGGIGGTGNGSAGGGWQSAYISVDFPLDGRGVQAVPAGDVLSPVFTMWVTLVAVYIANILAGQNGLFDGGASSDVNGSAGGGSLTCGSGGGAAAAASSAASASSSGGRRAPSFRRVGSHERLERLGGGGGGAGAAAAAAAGGPRAGRRRAQERHRTLEAATAASMADSFNDTPSEGDGFTYEHLDERRELWLDFMADTGDGGNATYAVASALAAPVLHVSVPPGFAAASPAGAVPGAGTSAATVSAREAEAPGKKHGRRPAAGGGGRHPAKPGASVALPRGDVLVIGGDLAYPNPSRETYHQRLFRPFEDALPPPPHFHPGRLVVHKPDLPPGAEVAGRSAMEKSYFALRLPAGWWLFGFDLALVQDIDMQQYRYFANVVEQRMEPDDQVILITHEPLWLLEWYWQRRHGSNLRQLVRGHLRGRARLHLAGDLHFYMRHSWEPAGGVGGEQQQEPQQQQEPPQAAPGGGAGRKQAKPGQEEQLAASVGRGGAATPFAPAAAPSPSLWRHSEAHEDPMARVSCPAAPERSDASGTTACGSGPSDDTHCGSSGSGGTVRTALRGLHSPPPPAPYPGVGLGAFGSGGGGAGGAAGGPPPSVALSSGCPSDIVGGSSDEDSDGGGSGLGRGGAGGGGGWTTLATVSSGGMAAAAAGAGFARRLPPVGLGSRPAAEPCAGCRARIAWTRHPHDPEHLVVNGGGGAFLHPTHVFAGSRFPAPEDPAAEATAGLYAAVMQPCTCRIYAPGASMYGGPHGGRFTPPPPPPPGASTGRAAAAASAAGGFALAAGAGAGGGISGYASLGPDGEYVCRACYPSPRTSMQLGRKNLHVFRLRNSRFDVIGGVFYFMLVVSVLPRCSHLAEVLEADSPGRALALLFSAYWDTLAAILGRSYLSAAALALLFAITLGLAGGGGVGAAGSADNARFGPPVGFGSSSNGSGPGTSTGDGSGCGPAAPRPLLPLRLGGFGLQLAFAVAHTLTHVSLAIVLLLLLELGVETCIKYERLGADGPHSLYRWYRAYEEEHFPDPMGLRAFLERCTLGLYPRALQAAMSLYDVPEMIAVARTAMCAAGGSLDPISRLQAVCYYAGMLAYYWLLATPAMGFVFGLYLYISVCWFHVHYDEAFSSLREANCKSFCRLHIGPGGDLRLYTLALDDVPNRWREDPSWRGPNGGGGGPGAAAAHEAHYPSRWIPAKADHLSGGGGYGGGRRGGGEKAAAGAAAAGGPAWRLVDYVHIARKRV
ncbi:hypothetical protein GPECTOR_40g511 [Gonium pectorale]|uniref:Calcineurin-like phosphoesterase domain-containing protein n=1 Tax=Gonium pectorale TaxID=33097 RepID=A0A150GAA1_GONPE|nr:hypothetical protein GPECTOR_40g511 [Gonium pectorale]|eukprot:KXZ46777.1 hypothetical protein GPECTOR_40g511 [Gonium pectorale]